MSWSPRSDGLIGTGVLIELERPLMAESVHQRQSMTGSFLCKEVLAAQREHHIRHPQNGAGDPTTSTGPDPS